MKKLLLVLGCMIVGFARINPFVLPQASGSLDASAASSSVASSSVHVQSSFADATVPLKKIDYGFGRLLLYADSFVIETTDPLKRTFTLDAPKKIVLDFAKKREFPSKKIPLDHPLFTQLQLGAHPSFYRMAISISQGCRVHVQKEKGYRVFCRQGASSSVSRP